MTTPSVLSRAAWLAAGRQWLTEDVPLLIFVAKTCLAALLALWIAFRLDFAQPQWSLLTVFIVARRESGLVMTKSFYRTLGTATGCVTALLLVALFGQVGELFLLSLSLWIGLCTALATRYRNFQAYGCMLAGYTAAIVGFGAAGAPGNAFDIAVSRVSEVLLGILCAGVVAEALFPQHAATSVLAAAEARFGRFMDFLQQCFTQQLSTAQLQRLHHGFVADIIALENRRGSTFFEGRQARRRDATLRWMNAAFMRASTTLHGFTQSMSRLRRRASPDVVAAITTLYADLSLALQAGRAADIAAPLRYYRAGLPARLASLQHELRTLPAAAGQDDIAGALALYEDFVAELAVYVDACATLHAPEHGVVPVTPAFAVHSDAIVSLLSGLRAAGLLLILSAFWLASAWPNGPGAIVIAAVFCVLFSALPAPVVTIKRFTRGFVLGLLLAYLCLFKVLPQAYDFTTLELGLLPFLAVSAWLIEQPRFSSEGAGMYMSMFVAIAPRSVMDYNILNFLNAGIALFVGLAAAGIAFALFPLSAQRLQQRLMHSLRRQALLACVAPLGDGALRHQFESRTRDLLFQLTSPPASSADPEQNALGSALSILELGHAVLALRRAQARTALPCPLLMAALAQFCTSPTHANRGSAIAALQQFIDHLTDAAADQQAALRISCHHLRSALQDEDSFADIAGNASAPGAAHAA